MLGVSHGALQFMTYEEMKNYYNEYRKLPIDSKLVSPHEIIVFIARIYFRSAKARISQDCDVLFSH
jgi:hypothetical protein